MLRRCPAWLRRGINVAGVFDRRDDTPVDWPGRDTDLRTIAAAGFSHVRLPVRWWGHAAHQRPWTLDERFAAAVDQALASARSCGLGVVLSMHHADGVMAGEPDAEERLVSLWQQVAARYRGEGRLAHDLLNEPRGSVTTSTWRELLPEVLAAVRAVDPDRLVIVGGAAMSTVTGLLSMHVPADERLLVTLHYYEPFRFTHQGARWEPGSEAWTGTLWASTKEQEQITTDLEMAATWATEQGRALYLGEFGTIDTADDVSRSAWTRTVRQEAERLGMGWAAWDFRTDFGAYDPHQGRWHRGLLRALLPDTSLPA